MSAINTDVTVRLPRTYDVDLLLRDLDVLREVPRASQPGPYHAGEWTGIALHSMGGKDSVFPSAAGMDRYQETESLKRTPYFKYVLDDLKCPKEVVRILFLPPGGKLQTLEEELSASHRAGFLDAALLDRAPLEQFNTGPCIVFPNQAQFHPRRYLLPLTKWINSDGSHVFEQTSADEFYDFEVFIE